MYAILHEGKSIDKGFFKLLLKHLNLDISLVSFYGMGSKSNFFKIDNKQYKDILLEVELERISKLLFIVDSDYVGNKKYDGYEDTLKEIKHIQEELNIEELSDIFVAYDMRLDKKEGYLESLILSTLSSEQTKCIESFLNCSDFKSKFHDKSIFNIIYKNAYPSSDYNFEHPNFNKLKQKLKNLFKEQK